MTRRSRSVTRASATVRCVAAAALATVAAAVLLVVMGDPTFAAPISRATGPTVTCVSGIPAGFVEFIGTAGRPGRTSVHFDVTQLITGTAPSAALDIEFPDHARYLQQGVGYHVRSFREDGHQVAYLTTDKCERPITTLTDGTTVNTSFLGPLRRELWKPVVLGLLTFGGIATVVFLLGRVRLLATEEPHLYPDEMAPVRRRWLTRR